MGFAQWIDRRIGDLRETLLAVIPERPGERGKKRRRSVVAHAPIRFFAAQHGAKKNFVLIVGPTGGAGDAAGFLNWSARCVRRQIEHFRNGMHLAVNLRGDAF